MVDGDLVKTRQFANPKYVGDPLNAVKIFNEKEVDELMLFDIGPESAHRPNFSLLEKIAVESRMPLCYGGGVQNVEDASRIISMGFEKVSISSAAIEAPSLVHEIAEAIGSQSVVVTLDIRKTNAPMGYAVYMRNGTVRTKTDLFEFCDRIVNEGVGEIVINSIDREGEMGGFDVVLAKYMFGRFRVPMTFMGGAGNISHMADMIDQVGTIGLGIGSMFVFKGQFRAVLISYSRP
jgi:imidazole glycerol-phosphate synthase subunit HisF